MKTEQEKDMERYLSTGELMEMLSISRSTVYRLIADGMPYIQVRGVNRFAKHKVLAWLERDDETEKVQAILQETKDILDKLENMQKQGETTGQKR